ncbi:hypothetical protein [Polyangium mundeleinium]|uniref:Uncharacterized protein n=1 Tax=Polyangium mundeleinium TaxID=2995306 RepID=A0ABT5EWF1_9BACT|nr:hypothetical protein [Polyangium mundeleinium]MDC0746149.1 hypothetical protein [Polyangium mundeleinium]
MRQIPLSYGLLYFLDDLEFTEAALAADEDAALLAPPFTEAIGEWEGLFAQERAARRGVTRAEAVVAVRNERLDSLTKRFGAAVRAFAPELLGKFFGGAAPGQFVRKGLRAQCEKTRDVLLPEAKKLGPHHELTPFAAPLDPVSNAALAALDVRTKAKGNRQIVSNETDEWKEGINALRTTTYAELLKIATTKKFPKSWVESFFRKPDGAKGEDGDMDAGAEAESEGP